MVGRARVVVTVEDGAAPLFLRIARAIADDIRCGRLRAGDALPGTRALAESLGVNRNTVVAAYRELLAEGWAVARAGGGTFVAEEIPVARPRAFAAARPSAIARAPSFTMSGDAPPELPAPYPKGTLVMAGGVPDVRLAPARDFARALRRALTGPGAADALRYGDPRGDATLRSAIATLVRDTRGVPATPDSVLVVRGSQMALELAARAVVPRGGAVAVEAIGYRPAWAAFARSGARVVPVPIDAHGLSVDALASIVRRDSIRAVYVTPHHQYPTTVTLSASRRLALLELARKEELAIFEDDYDHELHYDGRPVLPLASADAHGSVVYIGTLSKVLAPGLRLGYVVAPQPLVDRLARDRFVLDRQGDHVAERAAAELLEDGTALRHVRRMRRIYRERRDHLIDAMRSTLGDRVAVRAPAGGMALWVRVNARASSVVLWEKRALDEGVAFVAGERFVHGGRAVPYARFGFAPLDAREANEAVKRLARAWPR
jgi:GntR family transcriptional regulator/MocR family aminotransferase